MQKSRLLLDSHHPTPEDLKSETSTDGEEM